MVNKVLMLKADNKVKFNKYHKQLPILFTIYVDFEFNLRESQKHNRDLSDLSCTDKYQNHIA